MCVSDERPVGRSGGGGITEDGGDDVSVLC